MRYNDIGCGIDSQDSKAMLWDIRRANSSLMMLDQHNGDASANPNSGISDGHVIINCILQYSVS